MAYLIHDPKIETKKLKKKDKLITHVGSVVEWLKVLFDGKCDQHGHTLKLTGATLLCLSEKNTL